MEIKPRLQQAVHKVAPVVITPQAEHLNVSQNLNTETYTDTTKATQLQEATRQGVEAKTTPQDYNPFCGFSFTPINSTSTHFCTSCGGTAIGLAKEWDNGQIIRSKYSCSECYYKVVAESRVDKNGDGNISNGSTSSEPAGSSR